jgi:hypothetical protein
MLLGKHLRELAHLRGGIALSLLVALVVAVMVTFKVGVLPPSLKSRDLEMGTASTRVLVDTSKSLILDIRYGTGDFDALTTRADLLGNLMASLPVRDYIARRAHVPADAIRATTPLTPEFPRPTTADGGAKHQTDLLRSTDQYRLNIQANPTVPVLNIYAQAPTAQAAEQLANGAVDGMRDYLTAVAGRQRISAADRPRLTQLGRAHGSVINHGIHVEVFLLSFVIALVLAAGALTVAGRVRRGWTLERLREDDLAESLG